MRTVLLSLFLIVGLISVPARAEDKNGLRMTVTKKTLDRADGKPGYMRDIDRTMAMKAFFKNLTMKDIPEGQIECVILVRRWGLSETGSTERYTSQFKLEPLKPSQETELQLGDYHIGGHMHGTADYHVDQVAGWKLTIDHAGKKTEFFSSPKFDQDNKRAVDAAKTATR